MKLFGKPGGIFAKIKTVVMASARTKLATAAAVVAVAGGGTAALALAGVFTSPEMAVAEAALALTEAAPSASEKLFGLESLFSAMLESGAEVTFGMTLDEFPLGQISGELLPGLDLGLGDIAVPDAGFSMKTRCSTEKKLDAVLQLQVAGTTLLSANAYADREQVQAAVPKLLEPVLVAHYGSDTFKEQVKNSYLVEYLGISQETLEEWLRFLPEEAEPMDTEEVQQNLVELLITCIRENFSEVKLEKAGKGEVPENEDVLDCRVYTGRIYRGEVSSFLFEYTLMVKNYVKELAAGYGVTELEVEYLFHGLDQAVHQIRGSLTDVSVTFYVHEKRLVKLEAAWGMEQNKEEPEEGSLSVQFAAKGNPFETMKLSLVLPIHAGDKELDELPEKIVLDYAAVTHNTEDYLEQEWNLVYNEVPVKMSFFYEKLDGELEWQIVFRDKALAVMGLLDRLEKGKKFDVELEKITVADGAYQETLGLEAEISFAVLEEGTKPVLLEGRQVDVFALTEKKANSLVREVMMRGMAMALEWKKMLE
ncbi:MAG: hypothetical protein J6J42_11275 [Lachnospiraceae bacterium]|nr:hypothetical protein [Lachnospiraceae bacterium]